MLSSSITSATSLRIAFFGSSLVSAYWNGAATYYRGIIRALHERGHHVTFYEPDALERQQHRDIDDPFWADVVVYKAETESDVLDVLERAKGADVIIKASGVGVFDDVLEGGVLAMRTPSNSIIFWDVDAPATLERIAADQNDAFRALIPQFDMILTYGGGPPVIAEYTEHGARACVPVYNALDPQTHFPVTPDPRFAALCGFLGNRLPDREERVKEFFFNVARDLKNADFLLGGSGWDQHSGAPSNVRMLGHVYTRDHNAFNCTPRAVLNINRDSMARTGWSPPTRVFEAAGAGACIIVDAWEGIEEFLEPDHEVLVAHNGEDVARHLVDLTDARAQRIGQGALARVRADHTYARRASVVEAVLTSGPGAVV